MEERARKRMEEKGKGNADCRGFQGYTRKEQGRGSRE